MLPTTYFDRLTQALRLRMERKGSERRRATRIPVSFRPDVFPVIEDKVMPHSVLRVRDISTGGIGLLLARELVDVKSIIVRVQTRHSVDEFVMLCALRRTMKLDGISTLGGYSIEKVLYPGQSVAAGMAVSSMLWVDVSGDTVSEDPFISKPKAA